MEERVLQDGKYRIRENVGPQTSSSIDDILVLCEEYPEGVVGHIGQIHHRNRIDGVLAAARQIRYVEFG